MNIMLKPSLTEVQKLSFEKHFKELIYQSPTIVQEMWEKEGQILWHDDEPFILPKGLPNKLHGKQADTFVILLNKIINRNI